MATTPLKIVYVTPALYMAGGVERVLTLKANYFAEHFGYDITMILTEGKDKPLFYPLSDRIKVINLDIGFEELWSCGFVRKVFLYLRKQHLYKRMLSRELLQIRPDITISTLRREINFLEDLKDGSKKVGELHVTRLHYRGYHSKNVFERLFACFWQNDVTKHLGNLDRFVVLTDYERGEWPELKNVVTIPNPLPIQPKIKSPLSEKRIISVARYDYEKGIDLLLQAWSLVEQQFKDWRLDIYGEGNREPYERLIENLCIDRCRCSLHGTVVDVEKEYLSSSIFVLSSRHEGFGVTLIEAMACGLPVVSFDCPWGPQSVIRDKVDGVLVENGNVHELSSSLTRLMADDSLRTQMGNEATNHIHPYQIEKIAELWDTLFHELVD